MQVDLYGFSDNCWYSVVASVEKFTSSSDLPGTSLSIWSTRREDATFLLLPQILFQIKEQLQLHNGYLPSPRASPLLTHFPCLGSSALQGISYVLLPSCLHHYLPKFTVISHHSPCVSTHSIEG